MADYAGIHSEALYYVPLESEHEVWKLKVTNTSDKKRSLTVTGFGEFTNNSNYEMDQVNLQYSLFIGRTRFEGNRIRHTVHGNLEGVPGEVDHKTATDRIFGLAGAKVSSYCGDKDAFLGAYRSIKEVYELAGVDNASIKFNENGERVISLDENTNIPVGVVVFKDKKSGKLVVMTQEKLLQFYDLYNDEKVEE